MAELSPVYHKRAVRRVPCLEAVGKILIEKFSLLNDIYQISTVLSVIYGSVWVEFFYYSLIRESNTCLKNLDVTIQHVSFYFLQKHKQSAIGLHYLIVFDTSWLSNLSSRLQSYATCNT